VRILGFDTATTATTVALFATTAGGDGVVLAQARDDPPRGSRPHHTTFLLASIAELLQRTGMEWSDVDRLAVGVGPGTFTGLRVGIATARALGRARGIPMVGVSTLRSLAVGAARAGVDREAGADAIVAVLDARRGEVFAAAWRGDERPGEPPALLAPRALSPPALATWIAALSARAVAVGDGAVEFRAVLEHSGVVVSEDDSELHRVSAVNHCRLASDQPASDPDEVAPEYLRLPDAQIAARAVRQQ
jgi:tRNA threonylcarbamoyladenosine biosynthesis protein TsaB